MVTSELSLKISKLYGALFKYSWPSLCAQSLAHGVNVAFSTYECVYFCIWQSRCCILIWHAERKRRVGGRLKRPRGLPQKKEMWGKDLIRCNQVVLYPMLCCMTCTLQALLDIQGDAHRMRGNKSVLGKLCIEMKTCRQKGASEFYWAVQPYRTRGKSLVWSKGYKNGFAVWWSLRPAGNTSCFCCL